MPYENEHAARVADPEAFERIRDITKAMREDKGWDIPDGIRCLGGPKKEDGFGVQSWRAKADDWPITKFKAWLTDNDHKYQKIEEATGGKALLWYDLPGGPVCLIEPPGAEAVREQAAGSLVLDVCGKTVTAVTFTNMALDAAQKWAKACPEITGIGAITRERYSAAEGKQLAVAPDEPEAWSPGTIEGYSAIYGVVDPEGDRFIRGCFARSVIERVPAGHVKLMLRHFCHGGDVRDAVGVCIDAREDDHGLWGKFLFSATPQAQDTRVKAGEGIVNNFSVGYKPLREQATRADDGGTVNDILEAIWLESTLTLQPVNEQATVLLAKSLVAKARDAGQEQEAAEIIGRLRTAIDKAVATVAADAGKSGETAHLTRTDVAQKRRELELLLVR